MNGVGRSELVCGAMVVVWAMFGWSNAWAVTEYQIPGTDDPPTVLAVVQGFPVGMPEVRYLLSQVPTVTTEQRELLSKGMSDELPKEIVTAATEQWIERLLVLSFLERHQLAVSWARVDSDLRAWDERLQERGSGLADYRRETGISPESFRHHRRWEMSWQAYLERRLSDEALEKYFAAHRREFDGTRRRIAHVVLIDSPEQPASESRAELRRLLLAIRQPLVNGETDFAAAAALHSQGASAAAGGDLGWILRDGPLSEALSKPAFRMELGEISLPLDSPHGVHLIKVVAEEVGDLSFPQVKERVYQAAMRDLWQSILQQERPNVSIIRTKLE